MPFLIGLFTGPFRKAAMIGVAVAAALIAFGIWLHMHDVNVRAVDAARVTAATVAEQAKEAAAADAATTQAIEAERARRDALTAGTLKIEATPHAQDVVDDPAVNSALDALFGTTGAGDSQAKGAGVPVRLRPDAGTPAPANN
jgi:type VI protein secretion system component VasK